MTTEPLAPAVGFLNDRYATFVKEPDNKTPSARLYEIEKVHAGMVVKGEQEGNRALTLRARRLHWLTHGLRKIQLTREARGSISEADAQTWDMLMEEYEMRTGVRPVEVS